MRLYGMSDEPNKPGSTWLWQSKADGWHMTEVTMPDVPDDGTWRKTLAVRVLALAAAMAIQGVAIIDRSLASTIVSGCFMAVWVAIIFVAIYKHGRSLSH
jgi:hypothetical protein